MRESRLTFFACLTAAGLIFITPASARTIVSKPGVMFGTILIDTSDRRLYLGLGGGKVMQYTIGVGRAGRQWTGKRFITRKVKSPAWRPTADIRRDNPNIPVQIPGGAPNNPMGAAALLISGSGQYAIHGTNRPGSIGGFVSYGCIRMHNSDVLDLYSRITVGTPVVVRR